MAITALVPGARPGKSYGTIADKTANVATPNICITLTAVSRLDVSLAATSTLAISLTDTSRLSVTLTAPEC